MVNALADSTVDVITLKSDIAVSSTLIVKRAVTLDIYGYMLEMTGSGSVIKVYIQMSSLPIVSLAAKNSPSAAERLMRHGIGANIRPSRFRRAGIAMIMFSL